MNCSHCNIAYDYGHSDSPYDHYCKTCHDLVMKQHMEEYMKKYDLPEDRDFVTQKEVDTAIADLKKLAEDLAA